jgi:hypothetical protein
MRYYDQSPIISGYATVRDRGEVERGGSQLILRVPGGQSKGKEVVGRRANARLGGKRSRESVLTVRLWREGFWRQRGSECEVGIGTLKEEKEGRSEGKRLESEKKNRRKIQDEESERRVSKRSD